jgi:osmoprotectant transport system permease protein
MSARLLATGNGLPGLDRVAIWFNDPSNWWGPGGLLARIREHLLYTAVIVVIAVLIALPLGLLIGHTGRGVVLIGGLANGLRAIPAFGLLIFLVVLLSAKIPANKGSVLFIPRGGMPYFIPAAIVLVVLAIPPILTNTYAGVQAVDPAARDAARGMGMRGGQVLRHVEFPCALPLIMSGIRSATLQVIATATIVAYLPFLGGLGRFIIDGDQQLLDPQFGYPAMVSAGIVVAVLAVIVDAALSVVQRFIVSPGISDRALRRRSRRDLSQPRREVDMTIA